MLPPFILSLWSGRLCQYKYFHFRLFILFYFFFFFFLGGGLICVYFITPYYAQLQVIRLTNWLPLSDITLCLPSVTFELLGKLCIAQYHYIICCEFETIFPFDSIINYNQ